MIDQICYSLLIFKYIIGFAYTMYYITEINSDDSFLHCLLDVMFCLFWPIGWMVYGVYYGIKMLREGVDLGIKQEEE